MLNPTHSLNFLFIFLHIANVTYGSGMLSCLPINVRSNFFDSFGSAHGQTCLHVEEIERLVHIRRRQPLLVRRWIWTVPEHISLPTQSNNSSYNNRNTQTGCGNYWKLFKSTENSVKLRKTYEDLQKIIPPKTNPNPIPNPNPNPKPWPYKNP